jgi:cardiolipin synthase
VLRHLPATADTAIALAERMGHMPVLAGNAMSVTSDSESFTHQLVADIDAARHHVHLLVYIFADDETGRRVGEALVSAAARGVSCRLIFDSAGSRRLIGRLPEQLRRDGVQVVEALPVGLFRRRLHRLDMRNHRKIAVIDGAIAYAGSQNIVNPGYGHRDLVWHDLMVRLTGPVVLELQALFTSDWYYETDQILDAPEYFRHPERTGDATIQTLPSGPNYPTQTYQRMILAAIFAARHQITITTPYFIPDEAVLQAFEIARLRGVDIRLILPARTDHWLVDNASHAYYQELLEAGIKLYHFQPGLIHAKTVTVDDVFAFCGSSNFDIRSFQLNFEVNLMFYDPASCRTFLAAQERYREMSVPVDLYAWRRRPTRQRLAQHLAALFSPLL